MNEHHQPLKKYGIMALKGKILVKQENWKRYWVIRDYRHF